MSSQKTNFNSTETSQRLLAAFIASLPPGFKFDYKTVAKMLDTTESAIEHRFRPLKVQAEFLREGYAQNINGNGKPPKEYLKDLLTIKSRDQIQKYFGASTEQGLAFQARAWKANAKVLVDAVDKGQDPVAAFSKHYNGGSSSTPKRVRGPAAATKTPGTATKRRKTSTTNTTQVAATIATAAKEAEPSPSDDVDSPEVNYEELDLTDDSPLNGIKREKLSPNRTPVAPGSGMSKYKANEISQYRVQDAAAAAAKAPSSTTPTAMSKSNINNDPFTMSPVVTNATTPVVSDASFLWGLNTGFGDDDDDDDVDDVYGASPSKSKRRRSQSAAYDEDYDV